MATILKNNPNIITFIVVVLLIIFFYFMRYNSSYLPKNKENFLSTQTTQYNFIHIPKNAGTSIKAILTSNENTLPINYIPHAYPQILKNEIVILRDPIDRFISAFYYSKQKWPNIANAQFNTPNDMIMALINSNHNLHKYAKIMIINDTKSSRIRNNGNVIIHTVNGKATPYIWTYMPQSSWVNNPSVILKYDNLNNDFENFLKKAGLQKGLKTHLPKKNSSKHYNCFLSEESKQFLYEFYKDDYDMFEKLKLK